MTGFKRVGVIELSKRFTAVEIAEMQDCECKVDEPQDIPTQVFSSFFEEFTFGQYSKELPKTLLEVIETDKSYINWCLRNNVIAVSGSIEARFERKMRGNND